MRKEPRNQLALFRLPGHKRPELNRCLPHIQPQIRLPLVRVLPMTIKTILRQDRPDVLIVGHFRHHSKSGYQGKG